MWTDKELSTTLERVNPVPDPETLPDHGDLMWASLESKRADRSSERTAPLYRHRAVLVLVALAVLVAVPAVASLLGADDPPPLDREFGTVEEPLLTVYGSERGIPDGCAWRVAFAPVGTPLVGGHCGVFELADGRWDLIATEEAVGVSFMDLVVDGDGGVWVASPDQPLRRLIGDMVTEMEIVSPWIAVAPDGTIWAVDFGPTTENELVVYAEGSWRRIEGVEMVHGVTVDADANAWILAGDELLRVAGDRLDVVEFERPEGSLSDVITASDGAVWLVVDTSETIDRLGVSDTVTYIVRHDGSSSSRVEVPFAEISDLAVHPDGTLWVSSIHGLFFYDGVGWTRYGIAEGMPANQVHSLEIAPDGSVYATTDRGVVRIRTDG
jgi:streptogramin lyase